MFWFAPYLRDKSKRPFSGTVRPAAHPRNENPLFQATAAFQPRRSALLPPAHVNIRKLWPSDTPDILDHFQRLGGEALSARFGGSVSQAFLATYAATVTGKDVVAYGAYVGGKLRGLAELHLLEADARKPGEALRAEAAFSVEPAFRLHGLGTALAERILIAARNRDVGVILSYCLPENRAVRGLVGKLGASIRVADGVATGEIDPGEPEVFGGVLEHLDDAQQLLLRLSPLTMYGRLFPGPGPD